VTFGIEKRPPFLLIALLLGAPDRRCWKAARGQPAAATPPVTEQDVGRQLDGAGLYSSRRPSGHAHSMAVSAVLNDRPLPTRCVVIASSRAAPGRSQGRFMRDYCVKYADRKIDVSAATELGRSSSSSGIGDLFPVPIVYTCRLSSR
jgi:hypothetical protein